MMSRAGDLLRLSLSWTLPFHIIGLHLSLANNTRLSRHVQSRSLNGLPRVQCNISARCWRPRGVSGLSTRTLRTDGRLIAGSGDLVRDWALAGHGLAFKSIWDVAADIVAKRLVPLFADQPSTEADIHVVYPARHL